MTIAIPRLDRSRPKSAASPSADFLVPVRVAERTPHAGPARRPHRRGCARSWPCRAQVVIPIQPVPFTGQTFGVLLVGGALGFRRGAARAAPVPGGRGDRPAGLRPGQRRASRHSSAPTGGYLIGFVVAAAIVGRLAELGWDRTHRRFARRDGHRHRRHLRDRRAVAEGRRPASRGRRPSPVG